MKRRRTGFEATPVERLRRWLTRRRDFLGFLPRGSVGAEVGVFKGEFSAAILRKVRPVELHLIDPWWRAYGDRFPDWGPYTDGGKLETRAAFEMANRRVERANRRETRVVFHVADALECLPQFADAYFDWIYIDSTHLYEGTRDELEIARLKVKDDGFILGHDWQPEPGHRHHGVCRAVREFCDRHAYEVWRLDHHTQWCIRRRRDGSRA